MRKAQVQIEKQTIMPIHFTKSELLLHEALKLFPTGTQTAMKSAVSFPVGISPLYAKRAQGSRLWDIDGNEYIDFVNALGAITLGYNDPDVMAAVSEQLESGTLFSLSCPLELDVAKLLVEMIPCCEMIRFGKNGSDMTTTAIRLARMITGRDHLALCGYHGWHDWSIAPTSQNKGIPEAVKDLSHKFEYNDFDSLESIFRLYPSQIAAVVLEPMRMMSPRNGFLESIREICTKNSTLLIFDEIVTGFRLANGGAQEFFGVEPDLAVFAKGISNGFPLSALVGRRHFMEHLAKTHASLTYGGDTIALAAAKAVLEKYKQKPVVATIRKLGKRLLDETTRLVELHDLTEIFQLGGDPSWPFMLPRGGLGYGEPEIRTFFLQEMFIRGYLVLGAHAISYAHTESDINQLLTAYAEILPVLAMAIRQKTLPTLLKITPPKQSVTNWR